MEVPLNIRVSGVNSGESESHRQRSTTNVEACGPSCFKHSVKEMVFIIFENTENFNDFNI